MNGKLHTLLFFAVVLIITPQLHFLWEQIPSSTANVIIEGNKKVSACTALYS
jgi:hypothetical protein